MPRLIDISVPVTRGLPTWPGSTGFRVERTLAFERGDDLTVSRLDLDLHTGTHVESALHYVRLVGTDYLSIQRFGDDPETHRVLMRAGVAILEGLDLSAVEPGDYRLTCLPLRLYGSEAAPARAILEPLVR